MNCTRIMPVFVSFTTIYLPVFRALIALGSKKNFLHYQLLPYKLMQDRRLRRWAYGGKVPLLSTQIFGYTGTI